MYDSTSYDIQHVFTVYCSHTHRHCDGEVQDIMKISRERIQATTVVREYFWRKISELRSDKD